MIKKLLLGLMAPTFLLAANNMASLNLNSTDLEISYERSKNISNSSKLYYGATILKGEDEFEKNHNLLSGHFKAIGNTPMRGLAVGIGINASATSIKAGGKTYNPFALPLEIDAIYTLPVLVKSHIAVMGLYAPESLCINDCKSYTELRVEGAIEPFEGGMVVVGYRDIEIDINNKSDNYEFNKAAYLGFRWYF